jgi:hypothetical protein
MILTLALGVLLGGCTFPQPHPQATATKTYRTPTQADLTAMEQQIKALGHVTAVHLRYSEGTFGGSSPWCTGDIISDAIDQATLNSILDGSFRIIWLAPGIAPGSIELVVKNPATGREGSYRDLGFNNGAPSDTELQGRYGSPP